MKKILASDNSLKLMSVIIAICIWIYIAIVMNPAIEVNVRDLPIQFTGQETLAGKNLAVISESATTMSVKVKGSRKKMGNNDMKSIIVKADVSGISETGITSVPVEVVVPFENQGISSQSIYTVDVKVERIAEKTVDVEVETIGTLAQDYMSGDISVQPNKITVKGPQSAVEKIEKALVTLNFNGEDVDIDTELPISFKGEDGKEISSLDAILKRISVSNDKIKVHCPVLKIRKVEPKANFGSQELPEGFSYKVEPSVLYIYGDDPNVAKTTEIETEEILLPKLIDNDKIKVKLKIPEGVKILYDVSEVEISVEK